MISARNITPSLWLGHPVVQHERLVSAAWAVHASKRTLEMRYVRLLLIAQAFLFHGLRESVEMYRGGRASPYSVSVLPQEIIMGSFSPRSL